MISTGELLEKTARALREFSPVALQPIEKGGSSRRFFRVLSDNGKSVILVHDLGENEENSHYGVLARFLASHNVPVPGVLAEQDGEGLLWLEDLGETDLWAFRGKTWEERRPLYESTLRGIARLHSIPCGVAGEEGLRLRPAFDERLYRWEQEYFVDHCLGDLFGIPEAPRKELLDGDSMRRLACGLAAAPRQLIHRDFQSQNILIRAGEAWFIDFQGMRPGLSQYDLASLLCDPYVGITAEERSHLLAYYRSIREQSGFLVGEDFERLFWQCAVQRLMQALGAYGFLSIHRGKQAFRAHVPSALERLREALGQLHADDRLDGMTALVAKLKDIS